MTPWMRKLHKWVGLVVGVQLVLWLASGAMMSWLDHDRVEGHAYRAHEMETAPWPADAMAPDRAIPRGARPGAITTAWLLDRPVYQVLDGRTTRLVDALNGEPVSIDAALAKALAAASYTGPGALGTPRLLERSREVRDHEGRLWRIDADDDQTTTIYLSAETGEILEHRNRTWRLFDVFWMLHIMDYRGRKDFNNPLVVTLAVGGLWLALTGIWLLGTSFRISEFLPRRWRKPQELAVFAPDGTRLRTLMPPAGDTVYVSLARQGLQLPSNCGGGQSCGLCEVRVRGSAHAPTSADRTHIGASRLRMGYRLACNLSIDSPLQIEVPGGAGLWNEYGATVEHIESVTPFLREIVLRPDNAVGPEYQPGAYIQVHIPEYTAGRGQLSATEAHAADWQGLDLPETFHNREPVRRAYSLSSALSASEGRLTLLARFSPGKQARKRFPPGRGSTYLYMLKPGDHVTFSGPFGDFALKPGGREKVFIGGGAGMAPLRAMIQTLLARGAPERIHYWYGARSLRDAPYVAEMEALAARHANFSWHLVISEATERDDALLQGLVHEAAADRLLQGHPDLQSCDFYLCGPPAMLSATRHLLAELGIPESHVAFDDFKI